MRSAIAVAVVLLASCNSGGESATTSDAEGEADGGASDSADGFLVDSTGDAGVDPDADADDLSLPETRSHPDAAGYCQSRGELWPCEKGGACTFDGHCVPPDAGDEGGIKPCGQIGCDPVWCTCINATKSTCDCTP